MMIKKIAKAIIKPTIADKPHPLLPSFFISSPIKHNTKYLKKSKEKHLKRHLPNNNNYCVFTYDDS